jgi:hypothetical protein
MLFRETVAVYCENHTEHTNTLCGQNTVYINSVRTSQETHYVSVTKSNRLMLFRETVAVYCENHAEHKYNLWAERRVFFMAKEGSTHSNLGANKMRDAVSKQTAHCFLSHAQYASYEWRISNLDCTNQSVKVPCASVPRTLQWD